jgi:oxaloacetate decarboxylase gamma subunit
MSDEFLTGLRLMAVGMSTVFVVLGIVVYTGKLLVLFVNKLPQSQIKAIIQPPDVHIKDPSGAKIAAITGAIHTATGGKGQITHIERLE